MLMSHSDLVSFFEKKLGKMISCGNTGCECLSFLLSLQLSLAIANYLAWFENCSRYKQDLIILQWVIYRKRKSGAKYYYFNHIPLDGSCFADDKGESIKALHTHLFCTAGLQIVMGIGYV